MDYDRKIPIGESLEHESRIAADLCTVWVAVRKSTLQFTDGRLPNDIEAMEEKRMIVALMRRYHELTPEAFANCIREAAKREAREWEQDPSRFTRLTFVQIEAELRPAVAVCRSQAVDNAPKLPQAPVLPLLHGDPETALDREWGGYWAKYKATLPLVAGGLLWTFWNDPAEPNGMAVLKVIAQRIAALPGFSRGDALCKTEDEFISRIRTAYPAESELLMRYPNLTQEAERESLKAALSRRFADVTKFPDWEFCKQVTLVKYYGQLMEAAAKPEIV